MKKINKNNLLLRFSKKVFFDKKILMPQFFNKYVQCKNSS